MSKKNKGFTLIEVLVALAILGIALTAIIRAASQTIKHTSYLQEKSLAALVGYNTANEIRAGLRRPASDFQQQESDMFNRHWLIESALNNTPNANIKKIIVRVYEMPAKQKLIEMESYLYVATR